MYCKGEGSSKIYLSNIGGILFTTIGITNCFLNVPHLNKRNFKFDYILSFQQCEVLRILDLICTSPLSNLIVIIDFLI